MRPCPGHQICRLLYDLSLKFRHMASAHSKNIEHAVAFLWYTLKTEQERAEANKANRPLHTSLAALLHYRQHCARVNYNYAIITFLWQGSAYIYTRHFCKGSGAREYVYHMRTKFCGTFFVNFASLPKFAKNYENCPNVAKQ